MKKRDYRALTIFLLAACTVLLLIVPETEAFVTAISAGNNHTVALTSDGTVVAWGDSASGAAVPAGLTGITAIAAGSWHTVAAKSDGTVVAWGNNYGHACDVPAVLSGVISVAAGQHWSAALRNDGSVVIWGDPVLYRSPLSADFSSGIVSIAGGGYTLLGLKNDGTVVLWGDGDAPPAGLSGVTDIAVSSNDGSFALKSDGSIVVWGTAPNYWGPMPPDFSNGDTDIAAGGYFALALKSNSTVVGWGSNYQGQLDIPAGLAGVVAVATGYYHSVALKSDGTVACWGDNYWGQCNVPASLSFSPTSVGYNPQWLIVTLLSLTVAGGYLLRRRSTL